VGGSPILQKHDNWRGQKLQDGGQKERAMKTKLFVWAALTIFLGVGMGTAGAATNDVSALLQKGLFEEEANQNLDGAIEAYQAVIAQAEKTRQFAATAIFRLGECYRKEGKTNEAASQYQRILGEFADQTTLVTLSRQNLAGMGVAAAEAPTPDNSDAMLWSKVKDLSPADLEKVLPTLAPDPVLTALLQNRDEAESKLTQLLATEGEHNPEVLTEKNLHDVLNKQISDKIAGIMEALKLRAEISGTAGSAAATAPGSETTSDEDQEIRRIQKMVQNSPDLINGPNGPLNRAATAGQLRVAAYLLDHGANVNGVPGSDPPLVVAAANAQKAMVELLLSRGADVNARDDSRRDGAVNGGQQRLHGRR
jgi:tetratricopeptide (TPR) repeat protein